MRIWIKFDCLKGLLSFNIGDIQQLVNFLSCVFCGVLRICILGTSKSNIFSIRKLISSKLMFIFIWNCLIYMNGKFQSSERSEKRVIKKVYDLLGQPSYLPYFSIKSLIFKLATAVDDHEIYTGHSILSVYPLWKISRSSTGVANPNFQAKAGK